MVIPPVLAQMVRAIGGPTGPVVGAMGPTGQPGYLLATGATGLVGPTGLLGLTGSVGAEGLDSALSGPTGKPGPDATYGYPGPVGVTGFSGIVPPDQFVYYENRTGLVGLPYPSGDGLNLIVGCNFIYTLKRSGNFFVAFSGLAQPDHLAIDIHMTIAGGPFGPTIRIAAPNMSVPFFLNGIGAYDLQHLASSSLTFDLRAAAVRTAPSDFAVHGAVININFIVMEF